MKLDEPVFGEHIFRIVISSWGVISLISTKLSSISCLIRFSLKSFLSDITVAMAACFLAPFYFKYSVLPFIPKIVFNVDEMYFGRHQEKKILK